MCEDHCLRGIRRHHLSDHQSGLNRLNDIQMLNIGLVGCPTPRKKMGVKNERDVQVGFFLRKIIILRELSPHKWRWTSYVVLIQLILYSLGLSCLKLLGFEDASRHSWNGKVEATRKEREKGPSSEVDISQWMMLWLQFFSNNWAWISDHGICLCTD